MHLLTADGINFISFAQSLQLKLSLLRAAEIGWSSKQTYCSSEKQPHIQYSTQGEKKSNIPLSIFVQTHTITPALSSSLNMVPRQ